MACVRRRPKLVKKNSNRIAKETIRVKLVKRVYLTDIWTETFSLFGWIACNATNLFNDNWRQGEAWMMPLV